MTKIRPAGPDDLTAVLAFGAHVDQRWTTERMAPAISEGRVLVALIGKRVKGVAEFGTWSGELVVWKLYVAKDRRGHGIGRDLLALAVAAAPPSAGRVLVEHAIGDKQAATFFERREFFRTTTNHPSSSGKTVWRARELRP